MNSTTNTNKILVVGATGGTGRATVEALLAAGHEVTAFSRSASRFVGEHPHERLRAIDGDVMDPTQVSGAVLGHDAVIVTLGIRENPIRVRLLGPARTPLEVRSQGTRHVVAAMRRHGVSRLIVQSSFGVGETRDRLGFADRLFFALLIRPQIEDTEVQEQVVRGSELNWTIAQPVHLSDDEEDSPPFASSSGDTRRMKVSRRRVARFLVDALERPELTRRSVAVSG
jgi:putative NADH-flavin reductase